MVPHIGSGDIADIVKAFLFVMTLVSNCLDRTALHANAATPLGMPETPVLVSSVRAGCRLKVHFDDHRAETNRFANLGYQTIRQTKSTKPGDPGCVPFRPVGGNTEAFALAIIETG